MATLIEHKKARLNYEILETFEAGIELEGFEVKSVRAKQGALEGAHVTIRGNEAFLIGSYIAPFQMANMPKDYDPKRNRRLLLNKKQRLELAAAEHQNGLTVVPISMYNNKRWIKVSIALVRGKKKFDKREDLKKRQTDRDIRRELADR
jgi:SsrA-binding protein